MLPTHHYLIQDTGQVFRIRILCWGIFLSCNIYYDKSTLFPIPHKHNARDSSILVWIQMSLGEKFQMFLKNYSAFILRVKQSNLKCKELLTQGDTIIPPADLHGQQHHVKNSNLANWPLCWQLLCTVILQMPMCLALPTSYTVVFPSIGSMT